MQHQHLCNGVVVIDDDHSDCIAQLEMDRYSLSVYPTKVHLFDLRFFWVIVFCICEVVILPFQAEASYSLWSGSVRGNTQNVGMAGALTGLADDYYGAVVNPAGTSLTLNGIEVDLTRSTISDQLNMSNEQVFTTTTAGAAVPLDKMGFSVGSTTPFFAADNRGDEVYLRDYRFSFSRSFLKNHLSFGLGVALDQVQFNSESITQVGYTLGALYRFPNRYYLGATFNTPLLFGPFQGNQLFNLPASATLGLGWIPNRLFRAALSIEWIDAESNVFDFRQPTQRVGQSSSFQFHLGASYSFLDLQNMKATLTSGTYLESVRSSNSYRPHFTIGLAVQPWFLNLVLTLDLASQYENRLFNIGLDLKNLLQQAKLLPREVQAPPSGVLPQPFVTNEDWMPTKIQDHPESDFHVIQANPESCLKAIKKQIQRWF